MQATSPQVSTRTLNVLEREDAAECKSSEATWLPVTWKSPRAWQLPVHSRATGTALGVHPSGCQAVRSTLQRGHQTICRSLGDESPAQRVGAKPCLIRSAKQFFNDHSQVEYASEALAVALNAGAASSEHLFEQATHKDVSDQHDRARVEKAKKLLLNRNYDITEIAADLGFASLNQFNQAFKIMYGETPSAYRARLPDNFCCEVQEAPC